MLRAGFSRVFITPPLNVELAGDGFGTGAGVHDELEAQALVMSNEKETVAVITADLLMFGEESVANVTRQVSTLTGIGPGKVILSASHSHSTPTLMPLRQWGKVDAHYARNVESLLAGAVAMAAKNARRTLLGFGSGRVANVSENRRVPGGPVDTEVGVLRFDEAEGELAAGTAAPSQPSQLPVGAPSFSSTRPPAVSLKAFGRPMGLLTTFGCHPVTMHSYGNLFSADFPGHYRRLVRAVLGEHAVAQFALGAAGDVNPAGYVRGGTSPAWAQQVGSILGCEAVRVALDPTYIDDPCLVVRSAVIELPLAPLPSRDELRTMREQFAAEAYRMKAAGAPWKEASIPAIQRDWAEDALREWDATPARTVACGLQVVRIGEVVILASPLELFAQTAIAIRAHSPARLTMFVTMANGAIGYLPTQDAYEREDYSNPGGLAPRVYGVRAFAEGAEPAFRAAAASLLSSVFNAR